MIYVYTLGGYCCLAYSWEDDDIDQEPAVLLGSWREKCYCERMRRR
jgi:hypothetical protein